ncbi:MAG: molybdopterin-guanine dinucleotide biosynthesis protein B [Planctomycetes bacterium]|nr:molybdopterin-guanine dinucleotide biosynthesis protein B [Planctomycetota bacterium]
MHRIHIVGRKNTGKTTLVEALAAALARRGVRVGAIKHTGHVHELDTPGKETSRYRRAGAEPTAVVTSEAIGLFAARAKGEDPYERLAPLFAGCHVVLVEGDHEGPGTKVEVWRAATGTEPLIASRRDIVALITDDAVELPVVVWPRADMDALADRVLALSEKNAPGAFFSDRGG